MRSKQDTSTSLLGLACAIAFAACVGGELSQDQQTKQWVLTSELQIGTLEGAEDALTEVSDLLIGSASEIYIAQPRDRTVKVFDAAGRFVRRIGREGRGPGEFIWPSRLSWLGDTLAILDSSLRRVSYFDMNGSLLRDEVLTIPAPGPYLLSTGPMAVLPNGRAVGVPTYSVEDAVDQSVKNRPVLLTDRSGAIIDTLAIFPVTPGFVIRRGNSSYQGGRPFSPSPLVRVAPGGDHVYLLEFPISEDRNVAALRVTKLDGFANTAYSRVHTFPAVPIPEAVRDSVYQAVASVLTQGDPPAFSGAAAMGAAKESVFVPDVYPPANAAFADADGRFWFRTPVNADGMVIWEVLDIDGERSAEVRVPAKTSLRNARGGSVWGVELDEFDVPHIVRYRISTSSS